MPLFRYEARRPDGTTDAGEVEAANRGHALVLLRERGLAIDLLVQGDAGGGRTDAGWGQGPLYPWWPVGASSMAVLFDQLGRLLAAGVTPHEAFSALESRVGGRLRRVAREGATALAQGGNLSSHFVRYPRFFSPHVVAIMRTGELSGALPEACREIVTQYETEATVRRQMALLKWYLIINLLFCVLIPAFPRMIKHVYKAAEASGNYGLSFSLEAIWKTLKPGLTWYWDYLLHHILPWIILVWVVLRVGQLVLNLPWMVSVRDWLSLHTPVIGAATRRAAVARFTRTLELLMRAAVPPAQAVREAAHSTGNSIIARRVAAPAEALRAGGSMAEALRAAGIFSPSQVSLLTTAEQTGSMEEVLGQLAEQTRKEREDFLKGATRGGCIFGTIIAGVCVAFAAVAGLLTYYNTIFQISEGPEWQP